MPDIVLATLNAKFIHAAFGLRYLYANLGGLQPRAAIAEFDINQRPLDIVEAILGRRPKILGLGVYVWNADESAEVVAAIKRLRPEIKIILGGPEVSYETESQEIVGRADHVITGEGDLKFAEVCRWLLDEAPIAPLADEPAVNLQTPAASREPPGTERGAQGTGWQPAAGLGRGADVASGYLPMNPQDGATSTSPRPSPHLTPPPLSNAEREKRSQRLGKALPRDGSWAQGAIKNRGNLPKIIPAEPPDLSRLVAPYDFYTDADIAHRIVYVEASRGCPFTCEFCLSSLDVPVRAAPLDPFLGAMGKLLDRGLRQFKFVDRTFNLNPAASRAIFEFFLARHRPGNFYHFEMVPDRLPAELREVIAKFPPGALQFEAGVQTFNPEVGRNISRRQDYGRLADNLSFLHQHTRVHVHADLIAGLPGETVESFGAGFDRLLALGPQEIQVGILKRLRGTPIIRHDEEWGMIYNPRPPYEILQNRLIDFATMQRLRRFAKYWDLIGNSGNFMATAPLLWRDGPPFEKFMRLSDWLFARLGRTDSIALVHLAEGVFEFLTGELKMESGGVAEAVVADWRRAGRRDLPGFLRPREAAENVRPVPRDKSAPPKRQARHLADAP
jgi:radical SAM superfamily enzyme YgiQ (UPF0313 family)